MKVSVVMPARNAASHLSVALTSLWAQTRPPDECIVVVGPSTDATLEIVRADARLTIIEQTGTGLADARNVGVAATTGDVVAFLDADDEWLATKTAHQLAALTELGAAALVTGQMQRVDPLGREGSPAPALTPSGLLGRREVLDRVGPFDTRFRIACDTEWLMRARVAGVGPTVTSDVVLRKHERPDSLSRDLARYRSEMLQVVREASARRATP